MDKTNSNNVIKLNEVCLTCLTKTDNMLKLTNELITMLNSINGKFEIEITNLLQLNLCKLCEEKLIISYNFQQLTQKSHEIIQQQQQQSLVQSESIDNKEEKMKIKTKLINKTKRLLTKHLIKKPRRLPQYSSEDVIKAIERLKLKFHENRNCIKCHFIGTNVRALSVHMTHLHKELKEYWCWICNSQVKQLNEHYMSIHLNNELKCEFCSKCFMNKGHLIEHLRSHSIHRPFKCPCCDKGFISSRVLKVHFRIHTNERPYICRQCPAKFRQISSLNLHSKRHETNELEITTITTQQQEDQDENFVHIKIEPDITLEPITLNNFCRLCKRKVKNLQNHTNKYHSDNSRDGNNKQQTDPALCNTCGRQFKTNSKLNLHMRIHTGEAPYKCSYCDKRMSSRNNLVVHERTHTGEKPHVCNICGKAFAQSSVLGTHMKIHTGKPEICKICQQGFCRPAELRVHMRKHSGEKPFLCTECGQGFKQHSHLMGHLKTHSDERPFKCDQCERSFKHSSSLKSHIQIHSGTKPFKCSQCTYACRQSYSLTQHMRLHSIDAPRPDKPHICLICNKNFNTIAMLMSHTNSAHTVK